jgi:putative DNA primase/helicase
MSNDIESIEQATEAERNELASLAPEDEKIRNALWEQTLKELAALNPIEYDRRRDEAARTLRIRVRILDDEIAKRRPKPQSSNGNGAGRTILLNDPESWPAPVDGATLLDDIGKMFERYVILPVGAAVALALWILHTYTLDANEQTPYIAITSPEMRCGKSRLLQIMRTLASRALSAANITTAAVYRTIEAYKPTLLIDEADSFLGANEELRGVLNSGFERTGSVIRNVGDNHEPRQFATWCAKAIAKIGKLTGTLHDRSIEIAMRRKKAEEKVERLRESRLMRTNEELRRKCVRWAEDNLGALEQADPSMPETMNDREADCWRPLFAIADRVGGVWPERVRVAACAMAEDGKDMSVTVQLLADIHSIFGTPQKLTSEALVKELAEMEDRPWAEWGKSGKPISKIQLAGLLKPFGIKPGPIRIGSSVLNGYKREQFDDAFARYIPNQNPTSLQPVPDVDFSAISKRYTVSDVGFQNKLEPVPVVDCNDVGVQNGEIRDEERI